MIGEEVEESTWQKLALGALSAGPPPHSESARRRCSASNKPPLAASAERARSSDGMPGMSLAEIRSYAIFAALMLLVLLSYFFLFYGASV